MVTELLQKYIWLVQTFIRAGEDGLDLQEICDKWETRWGSTYSRRTFNNHRKDVEDVFGIYIECNRSTNRYFIEYSEYITFCIFDQFVALVFHDIKYPGCLLKNRLIIFFESP